MIDIHDLNVHIGAFPEATCVHTDTRTHAYISVLSPTHVFLRLCLCMLSDRNMFHLCVDAFMHSDPTYVQYKWRLKPKWGWIHVCRPLVSQQLKFDICFLYFHWRWSGVHAERQFAVGSPLPLRSSPTRTTGERKVRVNKRDTMLLPAADPRPRANSGRIFIPTHRIALTSAWWVGRAVVGTCRVSGVLQQLCGSYELEAWEEYVFFIQYATLAIENSPRPVSICIFFKSALSFMKGFEGKQMHFRLTSCVIFREKLGGNYRLIILKSLFNLNELTQAETFYMPCC